MGKTIVFALLMLAQTTFGQRTFNQLLKNKNFKWSADSSSKQITIYYQEQSWVYPRIEVVRKKMLNQIDSVKSFIQMGVYDARINLFVVESKKQMKDLIGWETNGTAFYKYQTLTGIATERSNSIYSNHELFHLMAGNIWGIPEVWLNEGMAVYADKQWYGYDLHQLANYLVASKRYIPLGQLVHKFRSGDSMLSYPLIGSFTRYLDETYGRKMVVDIWRGKLGNLEKLTGKSLTQLEKDWLDKIKSSDIQNIKY